MTAENKAPERLWVTRFKNEFDSWQFFHAFASKEKAFNDAGRTGEVLECIPASLVERRVKEEVAKARAEALELGKLIGHEIETVRHWEHQAADLSGVSAAVGGFILDNLKDAKLRLSKLEAKAAQAEGKG